jgi:hypothetical protein
MFDSPIAWNKALERLPEERSHRLPEERSYRSPRRGVTVPRGEGLASPRGTGLPLPEERVSLSPRRRVILSPFLTYQVDQVLLVSRDMADGFVYRMRNRYTVDPDRLLLPYPSYAAYSLLLFSIGLRNGSLPAR